ncbi:MAG: fasciclin domain-containing protein [Ilumatobacteraceae bacterium]
MKKLMIAATAAALSVSMFAPTASADETQTIAAIASGDPQFSTLVAALGAADLVGPFDACDDAKTTVFAPTNDAFTAAFTKLGVTAEQVLADKELLTSILTYHVVAGAVDAATVVTIDKATTLNGADVTIAVTGGKVALNGSVNVIATDIKACNGIIHVIDAVLIPPAAPTMMPATGADSGTLALVAAGLMAVGGLGVFGARRRTARATN